MPTIPLVTFNQFTNFVLPHVDDAIVDAIFDHLKHNKTVVGHQWEAFPQNPIVVKDLEDVIFHPLEMIWEAIVKASGNLDFLVKLKHQPRISSVSERHNTSLPDGFIVLKNTMSVSDALRPPIKNGESCTFCEDIVIVNKYKRYGKLE